MPTRKNPLELNLITINTTPEKIKGFVKFLLKDDGLGVITEDILSLTSAHDVIFYRSSVNGDGYRSLERGMEVEFELCPASLSRGIRRSINVSVVQGADPREVRRRARSLANAVLNGSDDSLISFLTMSISTNTPPKTPAAARGSRANATPKNNRRISIIDLITPIKCKEEGDDDSSHLWEDLGDLCIGESRSAEDIVAQKRREAEANGEVVDLLSP